MSLQNLYTLRDVEFPLAFEREKMGIVNLDTLYACGSYLCLKGDYAFNILGLRGNSEIRVWCLTEDDHFGMDKAEREKLFGFTRNAGTLQDRYEYLCNLIKEREKAERNFTKEIEEIIQRSDLIHDEIAECQLITMNNLQAFTESVSTECEIE